MANIDRTDGYLDLLRSEPYKIGVELKKSNNITIPKYSGVINFKYAKSVE